MYKAKLLTVDGDVVVNVSNLADAILYNDKLYIYNDRHKSYKPGSVVGVINEKKPKIQPVRYPHELIMDAKKEAGVHGFGFKYRNRGGKQYVTLTYTSQSINHSTKYSGDRADRQLIRIFFPHAQHTSGQNFLISGGGNHTYRINPSD